jgi:hypothetical protein
VLDEMESAALPDQPSKPLEMGDVLIEKILAAIDVAHNDASEGLRRDLQELRERLPLQAISRI